MLLQRVISASIGVLYLILMFYFGGWFFRLSILGFAILGMYEFYHAFINAKYNPIKWLGYIFIVVYFILISFNIQLDKMTIVALTTMFSLCIPIFAHRYTPNDVSITLLGLVYPGIVFLFLILLKERCQKYNEYLLILTFFATWATDTFAYFIGIKFGKRKLSTKISPKKTVEGSIGGLIASILVSIIIGIVYNNYFYLDIYFINYCIIGLICGVFSQLGDFIASSIKRFCGIKDFGKILPGHGGLLDRFDSILFTVPIIYMYYLLILI